MIFIMSFEIPGTNNGVAKVLQNDPSNGDLFNFAEEIINRHNIYVMPSEIEVFCLDGVSNVL